jgi:hypothetical protein
MTATHTLTLADGYGSTRCEVLAVTGPLASVRIADNAYWEAPRFTTRIVRTACLKPLN